MNFTPTRRGAMLGTLALAACAQTPARSEPQFPPPPHPRIAAIEARLGARIGVAALNTASAAWIGHRIQERFAMASTFKWLLAAQMLQMAEQMPEFLQQRILYDEADLLDYAPTARAHLARGWMTVEECCEAIVVVSDNTAANLLLVGASGPAGFTSFIRANADSVTRLDRTEPALNENALGDERDTTTPDGMARSLRNVLVGEDVLNPASREKLIGWMVASTTGLQRLRAGLPSDWRVGDKTGSGARGAVNDVAIAWPPGRAPIVIASYMSDGEADTATRSAAHAEIGRIIAETWG
ncbi:beta-lactamase [alpha proteobacterium U9-1i]|nr:beta-lactamase [alpha proteobacterium U9-1i]